MSKFGALFIFALAIALTVGQGGQNDLVPLEPALTADPNTESPQSTATTTQTPTPKVNPSTAEVPLTSEPVTDAPVTDAPVTTATPKIDTTVTPHVTTETPTTPLPPTPPVVKFNGTCIIMELAARFNLSYKDSSNKTAKTVFDLPLNTTWTATCGDNTTNHQKLSGVFDEVNTLVFTFKQVESNFQLSEMTLDYTVPDANAALKFTASNMTLFTATVKNSYLCKSEQTQKFDDPISSVTMSNVHIQAFHPSDKIGQFGTSQECPADSKTGNIVPIAVGAALAALVVIVLIAYLISRSRNQTGYESV